MFLKKAFKKVCSKVFKKISPPEYNSPPKKKYTPDFLVKLDNGKTLVLETKGQETRRGKEKRKALAEWIAAVNQCGEFGIWCNDVSYNVADVDGIIGRHI